MRFTRGLVTGANLTQRQARSGCGAGESATTVKKQKSATSMAGAHGVIRSGSYACGHGGERVSESVTAAVQ
jgi:hypothetical protein